MKRYQWIIASAVVMALLGLLGLQWRLDAFVTVCEQNNGTYANGRCEPRRAPPILERDLKRS